MQLLQMQRRKRNISNHTAEKRSVTVTINYAGCSGGGRLAGWEPWLSLTDTKRVRLTARRETTAAGYGPKGQEPQGGGTWKWQRPRAVRQPGPLHLLCCQGSDRVPFQKRLFGLTWAGRAQPPPPSTGSPCTPHGGHWLMLPLHACAPPSPYPTGTGCET